MTTNDSQPRLTAAEVLDCLREVAPEPWIVDECEQFEKLPVGDYMGDWNALASNRKEFLSFFGWLQDRFGFAATPEEWRPLMKRKATVAELAEFIAARAEVDRITPTTVLAKPCRQAAIFRLLERLSVPRQTSERRFGPSSQLGDVLPIREQERLARRLTFFFPRLAWANSGLWARNPETNLVKMILAIAFLGTALLVTWLAVAGRHELGCLGVCLMFVMVMNGLTGLLAIPVLVLHKWLGFWKKGPFAPGIQTFRDLVVLLDRESVTRFVDA